MRMVAELTARAGVFCDVGAGGGDARVARAAVVLGTNVVAIAATGCDSRTSAAGGHVVRGTHM